MKLIQITKRQAFAAFSFFFCLAPAMALPPGTWTQTFNEDFNGTSLDSTKWSTGYIWSRVINDELQGMRPENVTVAGGVCNIKLEKRDCWNQAFQGQYQYNSNSHYASGVITTLTKFTQTYGYFEARIKTPSNKGSWPAFWLLPDRGPAYGPITVDNFSPPYSNRCAMELPGQPRGNEIDVLESFGSWKLANNTAKAHNGFFWDYNGGVLSDYARANGGLGNTLYFPNPDTEWHTYGVYWAPGSMTYYIDDQIVSYWTSPNVAACPHYMILNCSAALDDWSGFVNPPQGNMTQAEWEALKAQRIAARYAEIDADLPSTMKIDWVRVYSGTASSPMPFASTLTGRDLDNGSSGPAGSDAWDATNTTCTVSAAGVWGMGDSSGDWGRMTFRSMTGDGSIVAKVTRIDDVGSSSATAGILIREDTNFQSKSAYLYTSPTYGGHGINFRTSATGTTSGVWSLGQTLPIWMKLVRTGNTFTGYYSTDGTNWGSPVSSATIAMNPTVQIGLGTSSHTGALTTAKYENVSITGGGIVTQPVDNGTYRITPRNATGKCLDVNGGPGAVGDGANVQIWNYAGGANQKWSLTHIADGIYEIKALHSGKCLDVNGGGSWNGVNVQQWTDTDGIPQRWKIQPADGGYYRLIPQTNTAMALEVSGAGTADGANVDIWTYNGASNMQWKFETP